ncbi:hypothetical protein [Oleiagrimonas sp. MCCC 1A03011]|uniref:hypothetical protein n=1 Tax=Oleiagrimonas sp. MCCC 1A03011 TaxID=1926883 RepID=UPI000DC53CE7|nr:hypothetical protein [Oleiagrimonas sp. MCCC 1A03011]RAP57090.1 hypothetical protein BTJ49_10960 [Oleiagrimonas sp. MCCC 1A03011]
MQSPESDGPAEPDDAPQDAPRDEDASADRLDIPAAWEAARTLFDATREFAVALFALARSELRLARVSWPLVFALVVVLVGLSLSLWASLIALIGWGLYLLTHSVGLALAALVGVHIVLLVVARLLLRRTARNMTMPATRAEMRDLFARARRAPEDR